MSKLIDETGNVYHRLTVISRVENSNFGQAKWRCRCECGSEAIVEGRALRVGHTKSCGCLKHDLNSLPSGMAAMRKLLYTYKRNARVRGHKWALTKEHFIELTSSPCHYCGIEPKQEAFPCGDTGTYSYNGIDRIDNSMGYTVENSVPCCGICNRAKMDMGYQEFLAWIEKVHAHVSSRSI